jgi:NADH-quinone oxidoreductase subunit C
VSPLGLAPEDICDSFRQALGEQVVRWSTAFDQASVVVAPDAWVAAARHAKEAPELDCDFFSFLSAIDWVSEPEEPPGAKDDAADPSQYQPPEGDLLQMLLRVSSTRHCHGVTIKADLPPDAARIETIIPVYAGADWHEREAMEMFGIDVVGHPNPVKLYLPDGFEGNPLRKSFKLGAREVKPWPGDVDVEPMPDDTPITEPKPGQP